jgi:hypothetical protein
VLRQYFAFVPAAVSVFVLLYQQLCQYLCFCTGKPVADKRINHSDEHAINQDEAEDDVVEHRPLAEEDARATRNAVVILLACVI